MLLHHLMEKHQWDMPINAITTHILLGISGRFVFKPLTDNPKTITISGEIIGTNQYTHHVGGALDGSILVHDIQKRYHQELPISNIVDYKIKKGQRQKILKGLLGAIRDYPKLIHYQDIKEYLIELGLDVKDPDVRKILDYIAVREAG